MNALPPTCVESEQPLEGATPPEVFTRWMKVVTVSVSPPVGPSWVPAIGSRSQGTAPSATNSGSKEGIARPPQTVLVSRECCHVARIVPFSDGLGLKKWVVTAFSWSLNRVACGVKSIQAKPEASGHAAAGVVALGHGRQM